MSTVIRNEISKKNKWYIGKHRYLELKHFCLQYPEWKEEYHRLYSPLRGYRSDLERTSDSFLDPTGDIASALFQYANYEQ